MKENDGHIQRHIDLLIKSLTTNSPAERELQIGKIRENLQKEGYAINSSMEEKFKEYISGNLSVLHLSEWLTKEIGEIG
jgi:hypothetical protein